jgi:hypothetical protein
MISTELNKIRKILYYKISPKVFKCNGEKKVGKLSIK